MTVKALENAPVKRLDETAEEFVERYKKWFREDRHDALKDVIKIEDPGYNVQLMSREMSKYLDEISIDNLKAGRISREAMSYAFNQAKKTGGFDPKIMGKESHSDMFLADILNDMFSAAKMIK